MIGTATYTRTSFAVLADRRLVGVVVHDDRDLHAAACRRCGAATYDVSEITTAAGWLRDHLDRHHGVAVLMVPDTDDGPAVADLARQVRAALRAPLGRRAVA